MSEPLDDISAKHHARGDVRCEVCENWTGEYSLTWDDSYLCRFCTRHAPDPPPAEVAANLGKSIRMLVPRAEVGEV